MNAVGLPTVAELPASRRAIATTTGAAAPAEAPATEAAASTTAPATKSAGPSAPRPAGTAAESGGILRLRSELIAATAEKLLAGTGIGLRIR